MHTGLAKITSRGVAPVVAGLVTATMLAGGAAGDASKSANALTATVRAADFETVFRSPLTIEGLTGDRDGNLYSAGRGGDPCPVWRVPAAGGTAVVVGNIPAPCSPAGLAFDAAGRLFVADGTEVYVLTPSAESPPTATVFTSGVAGANGVAFDRSGNLWISDGGTGQGRVWRAGADGSPTEVFRVQPMASEVNVTNGTGGIGRDPRALPPGTVTITPEGRAAANTEGSQHLVANGLAFDEDGSLFVGDTARGAVWKVDFDRRGNLRSPVGCDTTFTPNTLCLDNVVAAHPFLEGADGIALDRDGNVWTVANERNAVAVVTGGGKVREVFRNAPDRATRLRNAGPMEFPASLFLRDRTLCITHSDGSRRDNFPPNGGEVAPDGPERAKISCAEDLLPAPGLPLPAGS